MCLAKDPTERPTAPELLRWLETGEPPTARAGAAAAGFGSNDPTIRHGAFTTPLTMPGSPTEQPHEDYPASAPDGGWYDPDHEDDTEVARPDHGRDGYGDRDGYSGTDGYDDGDDADDRDDTDDADADDADAAADSWPTYARPGARHRVVTALLFGTLAGLAAVVPTVAVIGLVGWLLLARTVDHSASFVQRRRSARGRRALDSVAVTAALPWHAVRATLVTILTLPIAAVGAGILIGIAVLFFYVGAISPRWDVVCGAAGLVVAGLAWWGIEGNGVQRGSERILTGVLRRRWVTVATGSVLALLCLLLLTVASTEQISWWPLVDVPWSQLDWPG